MKRKPSKLWRQTGWKASDAGGYAIEHTITLPGLADATVHRHGASWTILVGGQPPQAAIELPGFGAVTETSMDRYRSLTDAKLAAEEWIRRYVAHATRLMRWKLHEATRPAVGR